MKWIKKYFAYVYLFTVLLGMVLAAVPEKEAEAAKYTYTCPHGVYDEVREREYDEDEYRDVYYVYAPRYNSPTNWGPSGQSYSNAVYVPIYNGDMSKVLISGETPVVGQVYSSDGDLYSTYPVAGVGYGGYISCSVCGDEVSKYVLPDLSTQIAIFKYKKAYYEYDEFDEKYYLDYVTFTYTGTKTLEELVKDPNNSSRYTLVYPDYGSEYESYRSFSVLKSECVSESDLPLAVAHTYEVRHDCTADSCREVFHRHEPVFDDTVYTYTCDCTDTKFVRETGGVSVGESECGHAFSFSTTDYYCAACGIYLYERTTYGCSKSGCWNNKSNYTVEENHPGTHTYEHVGIRYKCTSTKDFKSGETGDYEVYCGACDTEKFCYGIWESTYKGHTSSYQAGTNNEDCYHYYYLSETLPESCFVYGEPHLPSSTSTRTEKYSENCGEHDYTDSYKYWTCGVCGEDYWCKETTGCSRCGWRDSYEYDCYPGSVIGDSNYWYNDNESLNDNTLHRTEKLVCTTAQYGDYICNKVVTKLLPLNTKQTVLPGQIDTKAYATFLDGHMEVVTCAVSYDNTKYNEWQTATLSYGQYSSVDSKEPRTATIQIYVERVNFNVSLETADASAGILTGSGSYTVGDSVTINASAAIGYTFNGWYKGNTQVSTGKEYTFTMPANDVTFTAKFTPNNYTLKVSSEYASMGTVSGGGTKTYKSNVTVTATPKSGFVFLGWYDGIKCESTDATYTFKMPAYNKTLMAKFDSVKYTVSFDSTGGSSCTPLKVSYLGIYGDLPAPTKEGYAFLGWKYNGNFITATSPVMVKGDHTLTAVWDLLGPEFVLVTYGDAYKDNSYGSLPTPSKQGYTFLGWFRTENALGNGDSLGKTENIILPATKMLTPKRHTIHAGWKEKSFTLSFNSNGGTACSSMTITYDRAYGYHGSLPNPTKSGYTFAGWFVSNVDGNGAGTQIWDETRVQVVSNQTLYAKWTLDAVNVNVTFDARTKEQMGLTAEESELMGFGSTIGVIASGEAKRVVSYPGTYGGHSISSCTCPDSAHSHLKDFGGRHYVIDMGSSYKPLPTVTRVGYDFAGWKYNQTVVTAETQTQVAFGHTVYASYTPKKYTVALSGQGATTHTKTSTIMTFDQKGETVTIPKKTGYTFLGYFTGTRGNGTQYFDETGVCIKTWTETNVNKLYAYWIQDEIVLPEEGERPTPEVLPEKEVEGDVKRTDGKALIYADDYNDETNALTDLQPYLTYDTPASEGAIPSTELVSMRARMGAWILSYRLHRYTGMEQVRIYVTVPYRTQYEKENEDLVISERQTKMYSFLIPKAYSYWAVAESGMFYPEKVVVTNDAFKDGSVILNVDTGVGGAASVPDYEVKAYGDKDAHVWWDEYDTDGIGKLTVTLTEEQYIISDRIGELPDVDSHLSVVCQNAAWSDARQANVRSDLYQFNGVILLSDATSTTGHGAELDEGGLPTNPDVVPLTSYLQTYVSGVELEETTPNATCESSATITYVGDSANVGLPVNKTIEILDINDLKIHTPVVCEGCISYGMQEKTTESGQKVHIMPLKHIWNFFTLGLKNEGEHGTKLGYGYGDFRTALSGKSNIAWKKSGYCNEVKLSFDVYIDKNKDTEESGAYLDDYFVEAGNWITFEEEEVVCYIPITQTTGEQKVEFRTIAVNCPEQRNPNELSQMYANTKASCYVATDMEKIILESYIENFAITSVDDEVMMKLIEKGTQALTLKTGDGFNFSVDTLGEFYGEEAECLIEPKYYWISKDGREREEAEVYAEVELSAVKRDYRIIEEDNMWILEWPKYILQEWKGRFYLPEKLYCMAADTKQGFCRECDEIRYVSGEKTKCTYCQSNLVHRKKFDFEAYAKMQTFTGKEAFFKRDGYLMIHFVIRVKNNRGKWYEFTDWENTDLYDDALAAGWNYVPGDVIRYDLSKSISDDYEVGGVE